MPAPRFAPSDDISPMVLVPCCSCRSAHNLLDDFDQLGWVEGLDEPAGRTRAAARLLHLVARLCGQDQDRRGLEPRPVAQLLRESDAIHARHVLVREHAVEAALAVL